MNNEAQTENPPKIIIKMFLLLSLHSKSNEEICALYRPLQLKDF